MLMFILYNNLTN